MPGGFPLGFEFCNCTDTGTVNEGGTDLTPSATANTKGSYTQIIASTAADATWIDVSLCIPQSSSGTGGYGVDVAVGAAGSEKIIVNNVVLLNVTSTGVVNHFAFPISIPAGTAISARSQSATATDGGPSIQITLFDGAMTMMEGCAGVDSVGFLTASSEGTLLDPGTVANTKGSYAQLTASSSRDYLGFMIGFDNHGGGGVNPNAQLIDIAVGAAGSEKVIVPNIIQRMSNAGNSNMVSNCGPFFVPIPAGTAISARSQCSSTVSPERLIGVTLYGFYQ